MHQPRYRWFGIFVLLGAVVMFMPIHFKVHEAFWERLLDPSHILFFGGVTWLITATNPLGIVGHRPRLIAAMVLATMLAAAVEILQPLTGRQQSMDDFRDGCFGIVLAGSAMWAPLARRSRAFILLWLVSAVALVVIGLMPAWQEARGIIWRARHFPLLADFESEDEMRLWIPAGINDLHEMNTVHVRRPEYPSHGGHSLMVQTNGGAWPGVRLLCEGEDWTGYTTLAFDIYNQSPPFDFALRIDDDDAEGSADTRFNRALPLQHGWNHFRIPLTEIEHGPRMRTLHMNAISRIVFFRDHPRDGRTIFLDYVRLER
jgi:hypothetical protein